MGNVITCSIYFLKTEKPPYRESSGYRTIDDECTYHANVNNRDYRIFVRYYAKKVHSLHGYETDPMIRQRIFYENHKIKKLRLTKISIRSIEIENTSIARHSPDTERITALRFADMIPRHRT